MVRDDGRGPGRNPMLDPRLAGAGGMLIATAALAWLVAQGTHQDGTTPPTPARSSASATPSVTGSASR
jgi:hypothetical protein